MSDPKSFRCIVVTPEKVVLEREARFVSLPAHDGQIGFLKGRAPLIVKLDVGRLRVEGSKGSEELFVDGGFAEMAHDRLTVLTEEARRGDEIDRDSVRAELDQARAEVAVDDQAFAARQRALKRARTQLRMVERGDKPQPQR